MSQNLKVGDKVKFTSCHSRFGQKDCIKCKGSCSEGFGENMVGGVVTGKIMRIIDEGPAASATVCVGDSYPDILLRSLVLSSSESKRLHVQKIKNRR